VSARRESPRKRSRAAALQVLFALEFGARPDASAAPAPDLPAPAPAVSAPDLEAPAPAVSAPDLEAPAPAVSAPDLDAPTPAVSAPDLEARAQTAFDDVGVHFELPEGARAFAKELVLGVARRRAELDALIGEHASHWRVERMASVDRNVLRLGAFELLHGDAPAAVVIDEAVELARRFGGDRSPAFVNGVLDAVAAVVRPPEERRRGTGAS